MDIFEVYAVGMEARGAKPHSVWNFRRAAGRYTTWCAEQGLDPLNVKPAHVAMFLVSTGWQPSTMRVAKAALSAAYEYALWDLEIIERNPCPRARLPKSPRKPRRFIPNRVLRDIRANLRDEDDHRLFCLFAFTGLRSIEVRRLTWADVNLADNWLVITRGKGDHGRLVPIHPELRKLLVGRAWRHAHAHVAAGRAGDLVSTAGLHYRMKRIAGEHDIRNHDYRKTVASSLRFNGVQREVFNELLGWGTDGSTFEDHYSSVSPEELQAAILQLYRNDPV